MVVKRLTQWVPRSDVAWDDAVQHWRTTHVEIVRRLPGLKGYVQNVCTRSPDGSDPPYAGLGEAWFETIEDARAALASPEWRSVVDDAGTFMDIDRIVAAWADEYAAT